MLWKWMRRCGNILLQIIQWLQRWSQSTHTVTQIMGGQEGNISIGLDGKMEKMKEYV